MKENTIFCNAFFGIYLYKIPFASRRCFRIMVSSIVSWHKNGCLLKTQNYKLHK